MPPLPEVTNFYYSYCKALDWAQSVIPQLPEQCRRHLDYKETLEIFLDDHQREKLSQKTDQTEFFEYLDAMNEAHALIEVHKKFASRKDPEFITKLRESFYGPTSTLDEDETGSISKGPFGRNILSELIFSCKFKKSENISFQNHDLVYDLGDFKIGIEVKRIQKDENIINLFAKACKQLQKNPSIKYGWIALRLDKYYFTASRGKIIFPRPILLSKRDIILQAKSHDEAFQNLEWQTMVFREQFDEELLRWINETNYKNILGYSVFIHDHALLKETLQLTSLDFASHQPWERRSEPKHKETYERFKNELDFR